MRWSRFISTSLDSRFLSKDKLMLRINMKTLQLILSSSLVFFAPSYFLIETIAQVQPTRESTQPRKPSESTTTQTTQNATTLVPATATGSNDEVNSETIRQMLR